MIQMAVNTNCKFTSNPPPSPLPKCDFFVGKFLTVVGKRNIVRLLGVKNLPYVKG